MAVQLRRLVTGVDRDGRSCLVDEGEVAFAEALPGLAINLVHATEESPPPPRPAGRGDFLDMGTAPGFTRWVLMRWEPGTEYPMHHTDSVDFDLVLEGSIDLILDDGAHRLGPGDCVVMTGVDHGWRAGPDGCTVSVLTLGTPPPE